MQKTLFNKCLTALSVLTILLVFSSDAQAQATFRVTGKGKAPQGLNLTKPSPYSATGAGTYLRRYTGSGSVTVTGEGTFTGYFMFKDKNGDTLRCVHTGTFQVMEKRGRNFAIFVATFTPTVEGTTGRFVSASGSFVMTATTDLFDFVSQTATSAFDFKWKGRGPLTF